MSSGVLIWVILFFIFTMVFFVIAGFITFFGLRDLKNLLSKTEKK